MAAELHQSVVNMFIVMFYFSIYLNFTWCSHLVKVNDYYFNAYSLLACPTNVLPYMEHNSPMVYWNLTLKRVNLAGEWAGLSELINKHHLTGPNRWTFQSKRVAKIERMHGMPWKTKERRNIYIVRKCVAMSYLNWFNEPAPFLTALSPFFLSTSQSPSFSFSSISKWKCN